MHKMYKRINWIVIALVLVLALAIPVAAAPSNVPDAKPKDAIRFATFNASLNRNIAGQLITDLSTPDNAQARP